MIGERLSRLRKNRNMTQKDLANALMLSTNTISLYERNQSSPPDDIKVQIARMFNVTVDYLVGNVEQENTGVMPMSLQILMFRKLPHEAEMELTSFLEYIKQKYQL